MKKWTKAMLLANARNWYLEANRHERLGKSRDGAELLMWLTLFEMAGMPWS